LKLRAIITPQQGVFIDILKYPYDNFHVYPNNDMVGNSDSLYYKAFFEQYFHNISREYSLYNIPVVEDVLDNTYSAEHYKENLKRYDEISKRIKDHPVISDYAGKSIRVNNDYITLINSGNADRIEKPKKESVGITTRIGFTYGKIRGKIKFPAQLNDSGVWSGLTNAFWLINQSEQNWNQRRSCSDDGGYVKSEKQGNNVEKTLNTYYSEIDIEIIKTSKYWGGNYDRQPDNYNPYNKDECILACTNWDLACPSPKNFFKGGVHKYTYNSKTFTYCRWYDVYRALTTRETISNKIFNNDYYYYEIEWQPKEIIWRIGKNPNSMQVVGYMNDSFTVIPNNQMIAVITQEWHYTDFWPPVIYDQNFLPYPKNNIEGKVYEIVIE